MTCATPKEKFMSIVSEPSADVSVHNTNTRFMLENKDILTKARAEASYTDMNLNPYSTD